MDVDEFAQTRAPDDLFDEDYTPVTPIVTAPSLNAESHPHQHRNQNQNQNQEQNSYPNANARGNGQLPRRSRHNNNRNNNGNNNTNSSNSDNYNHNRAAQHPRDRGRGGRRRGEQNRNPGREKKVGLAESKWSGNVPESKSVQGNGDAVIGEDGVEGSSVEKETEVVVQDSEGKGTEQVEQDGDTGRVDAHTGENGGSDSGGGDGEDGMSPAENEVSEMAEKVERVEKRETAVRGDRSATGGPKRTKLTEAELTARLTEMSLKNASLTAAHKRAEADEASFQAREAKAATRRLEERANRTQMLGERERNAQRKLRALGHREWDVDKREEDYSTNGVRGGGSRGSGRGGMMRGGGVAAAASANERDGYETRPRRGNRQGGRGGRGNSNANKSNGLNSSRYAPPPPDQDADFPPLPTVTNKPDNTSTAPVQDKQAANSNAKETEESTIDGREYQKDGVETSTPNVAEPAPSGDQERKESLTMSELGGQLGGQAASWADQVEGAGG